MFKKKEKKKFKSLSELREEEWRLLVQTVHLYSVMSILVTLYGITIAHIFTLIRDGWTINHPLSVKLLYHFYEIILLAPNIMSIWTGLVTFKKNYVNYYSSVVTLSLIANAIFFVFEVYVLETALLSTDPVIPLDEIIAYASIVLAFGIAVVYNSYIVITVNHYLRPLERDIIYPENTDDIKKIIRNARLCNKKVRVVGSGHSYPENIRTPSSRKDYLLSLEKMNKIAIEKNENGEYIARCQAGVYLGPSLPDGTWEESLLYALENHPEGPFSLPDLGGITHQAVGGFLSTGSSGGSTVYDLGDAIRSITLVHGTGEEVKYERTDDPNDIFYAVVVSLGLLGIIVEVEFVLEKAFKEDEPKGDFPYSYFIKGNEITAKDHIDLPRMLDIFYSNDYTRLMWWPQNNVNLLQVWKANRVPRYKEYSPEIRDPNDPEIILQPEHLTENNLEEYVNIPKVCGSHIPLEIVTWGFYNWFMSFSPPVPNFMYWIIGNTIKIFVRDGDDKRFADYWWRGLPMDNQMSDHLMGVEFTEAWIDIDRTEEVIEVLQNFFEEDVGYNRTGNFAVEIYPAKGSKFWLHAANSEISRIRVDIFWYRSKWGDPVSFYQQYWDLFENNGFDPVYHPGKWQPEPRNIEELNRKYPKMGEFKKLRSALDPDNIFLNDYWCRMLLIPMINTPPLEELKVK